MSYVGMDLHKAFTQYAVVSGDGVILDEGRIENEDPSKLEKCCSRTDSLERRETNRRS